MTEKKSVKNFINQNRNLLKITDKHLKKRNIYF